VALLSTTTAKRLRGLVLEEGTAKPARLHLRARALGIPAVGEIPECRRSRDPGDAIIDGTSGLDL
jgi:phosphotransferase system enzyme I (PtsP)